MSYFKSKNSSVSLEWAAMFIGVVVVSVSAYLIFGTDLECLSRCKCFNWYSVYHIYHVFVY